MFAQLEKQRDRFVATVTAVVTPSRGAARIFSGYIGAPGTTRRPERASKTRVTKLERYPRDLRKRAGCNVLVELINGNHVPRLAVSLHGVELGQHVPDARNLCVDRNGLAIVWITATVRIVAFAK